MVEFEGETFFFSPSFDDSIRYHLLPSFSTTAFFFFFCKRLEGDL